MNLTTGSIALLGGLGLGYARFVEPYWLEVSRQAVKLTGKAGLDEHWRGYRIAFLTDLHLGRRSKPLRTLVLAVEQVLALRPNLVALGGDYFGKGIWNPALADLLKPILKAAIPVVGVMGNHDYFGKKRDAERIISNLRQMGVTLLLNQAMPISYNNCSAWIIGLDDQHRGRPNLAQATAALPPTARPLLLLSHNPDYVPELPPDFAELILSGHTHGGQVNPILPPFHEKLNWIRYTYTSHRTAFPLGWYAVNGNRLYVSRGLGMSGLRLRFNARPELSLFEFV